MFQIVIEVLYVMKFMLMGLFVRVMVQVFVVVVGVFGLGVDVGGDFSVCFINDSLIVLKVK